jgi:hypothetical protein
MWIPLEIVIYLLPLPIQFPIMTLFCVIFSLIMLFANKLGGKSDNNSPNAATQQTATSEKQKLIGGPEAEMKTFEAI